MFYLQDVQDVIPSECFIFRMLHLQNVMASERTKGKRFLKGQVS